jgi:hypothetical protein
MNNLNRTMDSDGVYHRPTGLVIHSLRLAILMSEWMPRGATKYNTEMFFYFNFIFSNFGNFKFGIINLN